ncbi:beta-galactosidase 14 [Phtheirospermum japonicum]|uniref:Beta-galactosidase n=1 Tax=Phtheirospermum japonicum TaxID=374723 RepID=A0A830BVR9_9LAMI|nr:beta-galactosidase 14 [Phtheirospermum japonicum]
MAEINRILMLFVLSLVVASAHGNKKKDNPVVTYDARSIIINGTRELLFSGSIHYPRSTVSMWPDLIAKAKEGGLNVIQTYVFWNIHEPVQGQYNFAGNYDLVKFIRMIGENGLWVTLRIGPYIEAEWNLGGFPAWLKEVPNITFRSYNEPFLYHMKRYSEMVINLVKKEKLFADQGGPIIMAQIENEYNNVQLAYKEAGKDYVRWAADMAVGLYNGVPWVMCKQKDAPQTVISTCNGRQCGDTFPGPNGPDKPSLWTENWTAQYRVFGDPPSQRAAEDIAFAVARFFARNGTLNNYYMYHGGTNFGRTSSSFVTTRYYDEAPLDEFGLKREPKFGHLRDLHRALRLSKKPLLWGTQSVQKINEDLEITTYEKAGTDICVAFLTNNNTREDATINFRGVDYFLPAKSISILPDCKTVVYNTQTVVSQHSSRNFVPSKKAKITKWEMYKEMVPGPHDLEIKTKSPKELYMFTKDTSDYAWYSTRINLEKRDLPMRPDIRPVLQIASLGHALAAFVNGEYVGFGHGSNVEKSFVFKNTVNLKVGDNQVSILAMTVGLPNSGAYMEKRFAGPKVITLEGLMSGTIDITHNYWGQAVGVEGEKLQLYTEEGSKKVKWVPGNATPSPITWYKTYFDAPEGDSPVAIKMVSMAKGMIWVNGISLGRYWVSYLSPLGTPTQNEYHIPREYLKPKDNLLVVYEESGGNPEQIEIQTVNRDTICSVITEYHPPHISSWERKDNQFRNITDPIKAAYLTCPDDNKIMKKVEFASFGNAEAPVGPSDPAHAIPPESTRLSKREQLVDAGKESCPEIAKTLAIQVKCDRAPKNKSDL